MNRTTKFKFSFWGRVSTTDSVLSPQADNIIVSSCNFLIMVFHHNIHVHVHVHVFVGLGFFCVPWFKVRGDCPFGWNWRNCWSSLIKLAFHNTKTKCIYALARNNKFSKGIAERPFRPVLWKPALWTWTCKTV